LGKKPTLTLVVPDQGSLKGPKPPSGLTRAGKSLWNRVLSAYRIEDVGGLEMLYQACAAVDRAVELSALIAQDGPRFMTKTGPKAHPLPQGGIGATGLRCADDQALGPRR
jgi:hypothetical protein